MINKAITMQIDHIAIWTFDLEKEKDFFLKYFDCKVNDKYENTRKQFSSYFLTFSGGTRIELMKNESINGKGAKDILGFNHIAINVGTKDKVESLTGKLRNDGFFIESYPRITGDGYYESVVLDPESNRIEITSSQDYIISEAKYDDLEQILYLQKCCYLSEAEIYNDYLIPPLTQTLTSLQEDFSKQTILKLEHKKQIIGSVRGFLFNGSCYIGKLIIDKDYQNMGFGKQLMVEIENRFNNAKRFELFTGFKSEKNLYLYHKLGYKEFKDEKINNTMSIKYLEKPVSRQ